MSSSIYEAAKDVFLDTVDVNEYIQIDRLSRIYQSLQNSIKKPLKMILLYGRPGTGKSMFLTKLYNEISSTHAAIFYQTPILDESEFYKLLAQDIFQIKYSGELNFTQFIKIAQVNKRDDTPVVFLDEAQLYSEMQMEKIRLLSDTRAFKFVIALHKTEKEDVIAKEHFQTRIWETIELENASSIELKIYIQKKLMKANSIDTANMFTQKQVDKIFKLTNGNYRESNKLLYTIFEIYSAYEHSNQLSKIDTTYISTKIVEMAAIELGIINA